MTGASGWSFGWPALLPLAGFAFTLGLGIFVWSRRGNAALQRSFAALNIAVALWNLDVFLLFTLRDGEIAGLLGNLAPREREVIELRFGIATEETMTLEEVGRKLGLSRERIRQIEKKAKKKLQRLARSRHLADFLD